LPSSTIPCGRPAGPLRTRTQPQLGPQGFRFKKNFQLAGQLGATGTPLFVIGDRVMNGAVGYDALKQAISAARSKKS
jgi:hypothetical protein